MLDRAKERYTIQSVEKALDVLEALSESDADVSVTLLSDKLEINKSTTFRLLATFEKRGYVERASSGSYRIGVSAFETGRKLLSSMVLLKKAKPVMEGLVRRVNESVYLAVPAGRDILMLDAVETTQLIQVVPLVGKRFPLGLTSAGKLIQAYRNHLRTHSEMSQIHMEGSCRDHEAFGEGITSVSVPLLNSSGIPEGCLCLVGPSFRMSQDRIEAELLQPLKVAGQSISSQLGHFEFSIN